MSTSDRSVPAELLLIAVVVAILAVMISPQQLDAMTTLFLRRN